jgi:uncharacterized protein
MKLKSLILRLLVWYKKYISRGEHCRFVPTCSEYTYQAVGKYGIGKGLWLGVRRVLKCRPGGKKGIDLLQ